VKVWRTSLPSLLSEFSQAEHTVREEVLSQAFADPIGFLRKSDAPELAKCSLGVQGEEAGARGRSVPFVRWQLCKLQQAAPGIAQEASVLAVPPCTPCTPNEHWRGLMVAATSIRPSALKTSRVGIIVIWKRRTNGGRLLIGVGTRGQQESESNHH
jgi:hypothetical protein